LASSRRRSIAADVVATVVRTSGTRARRAARPGRPEFATSRRCARLSGAEPIICACEGPRSPTRAASRSAGWGARWRRSPLLPWPSCSPPMRPSPDMLCRSAPGGVAVGRVAGRRGGGAVDLDGGMLLSAPRRL